MGGLEGAPRPASAFSKGQTHGVIRKQHGVSFMRNFISSYLSDESGAAAAEYALILTIIGTAVAAAVLTLGNAIGGALDKAANTINTYSF